MPRARSLKPGFFANEDLIELPFEWRLLFAGLWTLADREGRLEDRPKKIKLHIFPGDNVDVDRGLSALAERGFIVRYGANNNRYIQVVSWRKHQHPHVHEHASTIPAPEEHGASTVQARCENASYLTPSSLTPDSPFPITDNAREWEAAKAGYPQFSGAQSTWLLAERSARQAVEAGETWAAITAGVSRYAQFCAATDRIPLHVKHPDKWFAAKSWREAWELPPTKSQRKQDANVAASLQWLKESNGTE